MRRMVVLLLVGLAAIALGGLAFAGLNNNSSIHLSGDFELPANASQGQGQAQFHIADDGASVDYKLIASNIENVFMAHIHCGSSIVNGPIVVWLYPSTAVAPGPPGSGRHDGVLSTGTFTDANVLDRAPSTACPGGVDDLADVIDLLQNGGAYVNVHTDADGSPATNTGPGDLFGGEIRGNTP